MMPVFVDQIAIDVPVAVVILFLLPLVLLCLGLHIIQILVLLACCITSKAVSPLPIPRTSFWVGTYLRLKKFLLYWKTHLRPQKMKVVVGALHRLSSSVKAVEGHARCLWQRAFEGVVVIVVGVFAIERRAAASSTASVRHHHAFLQPAHWRATADEGLCEPYGGSFRRLALQLSDCLRKWWPAYPIRVSMAPWMSWCETVGSFVADCTTPTSGQVEPG